MNTDKLSKMYEFLSPRERLPLIVAACARRDLEERARLIRSAPVKAINVRDHAELADELEWFVMAYITRQLELLAHFWRVLGLATEAMWLGAKREQSGIPDDARRLAHLFAVNVDGWGLFCEAMGLDLESTLAGRGGWDTLKQAEEQVRLVAFSAEQATSYYGTGDDPRPAPTAEELAEEMAAILEARCPEKEPSDEDEDWEDDDDD